MFFEYAIALTGSIATGKSSVVNIFSNLNFSIIDADSVTHGILDEEYQKIVEYFGEEYVADRKVNRKALGKLIFSSPKDKKKLEGLLHPLIYQKIEREATIQDRLKKPYIIDIPLFFETNRYPIERNIVVYTPREKQLSRLMKRDNFSMREANQRIDAQMDIEEKREKATYLIDNSGNLDSLYAKCVEVQMKILSDF